MGDGHRKTKIVATIGPACSAEKPLRRVIEAGVDVCRLNFSHGDHTSHLQVLQRIRKIEQELGRPIGVLQDLCGPKIRVTDLPGGAIELTEGNTVLIVAGLARSDNPGVIGASLENLGAHAEPGHRILLDDGLLELKVVQIADDKKTLTCQVIYGGTLKKRKGINLPDTPLDVPSLTDKDRRDLKWGLEHEVDYVALSFVRHEDDAKELHELSVGLSRRPGFIAKIEKPEAVDRLDAIVEAFDGVMVARGDLSVEMPLWQVPEIQKDVIGVANLHDKLVITATQMLDSMQERPRPTRAEVSDVANAIHDGSDAIMLSGETASGKFPVHAVRVMDRIARAADDHADRQYGSKRHDSRVDTTTFCDAICSGAITVADLIRPCAIVAFTSTGKTARYMSKYHPRVPIVGATHDTKTLRRMCLFRGVRPFMLAQGDRSETMVLQAEQYILDRAWGANDDVVIFVGGTNLSAEGNVNSLKVRRLGEEAPLG